MSWATIGEGRGQKGRPEPDEPLRVLPMDMTSGEAMVAWVNEWHKATDPASRAGNTLHLAAYRTRFERLLASEATGIPAIAVTLPRELAAERPSHFTHVAREGRHLASDQRVRLAISVKRERARRRKRKL